MCFKYIWKTIFNLNITNFSWIRLCFWRGITRKVCRKQVKTGFSKFTELDGIGPYWYEFIMTYSISYDNSKMILFEIWVHIFLNIYQYRRWSIMKMREMDRLLSKACWKRIIQGLIYDNFDDVCQTKFRFLSNNFVLCKSCLRYFKSNTPNCYVLSLES